MLVSRQHFSPRQPGGLPRSRRGFALLIVLALLAFVVILLLGLAAYTRVETAVAATTQRQAQARENALLGLNVAIRQLQQYAGPDQAITATADKFGGDLGTRYYTGVWSSDPAKFTETTTTTSDTGETTTTTTNNADRPLTWLVSGNEFSEADTSEGAAEGARNFLPRAITPANPTGTGTTKRSLVTLVGAKTTGDNARSVNWVDAPVVDVTANGVPGVAAGASTVIGRYAWWVGDQGVKAPVAVADPSSTVAFAPYDSPDLQSRIRQQIGMGAGAASASDGSPLIEPRDDNNSKLVADGNVALTNQLALLRTPANAAVGLARMQQNFHSWSPNNFAVIANTKLGGLKQDLSLKPDLLGAPFVAWANYTTYMEKYKPDPVTTTTDTSGTTGATGTETTTTTTDPTTTTPTSPTITGPAILPAYSEDPIRRRYVITPQVTADNNGGSHQITPVLTYFMMTFNVRTQGGAASGAQPLEVRARWMMSLWNPYTSALVPENLQVEVTGLPSRVEVQDTNTERLGTVGEFSLRSLYAASSTANAPVVINLPWTAGASGSAALAEDRQSWLPGRVYTWRSTEDKSGETTPPADGFKSDFYSTTLDDAGEGVIRPLNTISVEGADLCQLNASGGTSLRVTLYMVKADGTRVQIGRFTSPAFAPTFSTTPQPISAGDYQFSYVFRLAENIDTPAIPGAWLTTLRRDLRRSSLTSEFFVVGENGDNPADYAPNYNKFDNPNRLLSRTSDALSYNKDVPIFELPRGPILSIGALQHFRIVGSRPFMVGNPWAGNVTLNGIPLNALFDRFFFSGMTDLVTPTPNLLGDLVFPNPLLRTLRKADGAKVTAAEVRETATAVVVDPPVDGTTTDTTTTGTTTTTDTTETPPTDVVTPPPDQVDARSSKYFVQAGAFNLNSTSAAAWAAVLRSVRFPAPQAFRYLDSTVETGTAADVAATVSSDDAQFFRFSQSAQETYKSDVPTTTTTTTTDATTGVSTTTTTASSPPTYLYRKGMRTLTAAQVATLAAKIAELVGVKHAGGIDNGGPFRSVEEFLTPLTIFAGTTTDADGNVVVGANRTLLEAAIADTGLNLDGAGAAIEFSSQYLTPADIMTALAPVLFPRSDTFIIRAYGEAYNPATTLTEGKAWCEAVVQRVPDYVDPSMPAESLPADFEPTLNADDPTAEPTSTAAQILNKALGRRFKLVSFRWLTRADI